MNTGQPQFEHFLEETGSLEGPHGAEGIYGSEEPHGAEGIPARYVQGYCVPIGERGDASVSSDMAHAWPEAYLEGVGWIPFEPTPGYGSRRYHSWAVQQPVEGLEEGSTLQEWSFGDDPAGELAGVSEAITDMENAAEDPGRKENDSLLYSCHFFGAATLAVLLGSAGLLAVDHVLGKYRYGKKSPEERFRTEVCLNLKVLSLLRPKKEGWETLEEFRERIGCPPGRNEEGRERTGCPPGRNEEGKERTGWLTGRNREERELPLRFTEDYEKVLYGGKAAEEGMIANAIKERDGLLELLKQERKWGWIYYRIRLYLGRYR